MNTVQSVQLASGFLRFFRKGGASLCSMRWLIISRTAMFQNLVARCRHAPRTLAWFPMVALLTTALAAGWWLSPPLWMWALAVAIFGGFKWATLVSALQAGVPPVSEARPFVYLGLWPGMDARVFLAGNAPSPPTVGTWVWAGLKTVFGAGLLWGLARRMGGGLPAGWVGMVGLIFVLHFGSFDLLACFWRWRGIDAQPLMRAPIRSASLGEFWGRRWNSGFRDLVFGMWFARWKARFGARRATVAIFLFSGLVHDLVISVPARGGYGLPAAYFTLQGAGLLAEHARGLPISRWRGHWQGRAWTWLIVAGPAFWLFHPPFVRRVILPFLKIIHAL